MPEENFSSLKFRVDQLKPEQDPFLVYHEFQKHEAFHQNLPLPRRKVLKYIVYFYDPGSNLLKVYDEPLRAKIRAAELAGFKREGERFPEMVERMIICDEPHINECIATFLIMTNDLLWSKYHVVMQVYMRASQALLSGETNDVKTLKQAESELSDTMDKLSKRETSQTMLATLQRFYMENKVELRPEEIAIKLLNNPNELPV